MRSYIQICVQESFLYTQRLRTRVKDTFLVFCQGLCKNRTYQLLRAGTGGCQRYLQAVNRGWQLPPEFAPPSSLPTQRKGAFIKAHALGWNSHLRGVQTYPWTCFITWALPHSSSSFVGYNSLNRCYIWAPCGRKYDARGQSRAVHAAKEALRAPRAEGSF